MLDGLDRILAWYQSDVRSLFSDTAPLFCDVHGQPLKPEVVRDRLARLLVEEARSVGDRFTRHDLRQACATHHYEQCMDLLTVHGLRPSLPQLCRGRLAPCHSHRRYQSGWLTDGQEYR
ncbi:tyrosine-type recombinase/integrase [Streptomyces sp. PB17]|uniref:tyrosine-type recombinase/integrase n=1 Tax=Streptomyces sp. PB17 TaxID=3384158 RepID=UPI0038B4523A